VRVRAGRVGKAVPPTAVFAVDSADERRHDRPMPLVLPNPATCSFCEYLAGVRPYTILDRDDLTATLVTYEQRGQGHVLVVPIEHRVTLLDLTAPERAALMEAVHRATCAVVAAFDPDGVAVWQNNGVPADQSVPHVHVHIAGTLPGGGTIRGPVERLPKARTDEIAAALRPHLPTRT
jgi:histidine triad (HIT) family protein